MQKFVLVLSCKRELKRGGYITPLTEYISPRNKGIGKRTKKKEFFREFFAIRFRKFDFHCPFPPSRFETGKALGFIEDIIF